VSVIGGYGTGVCDKEFCADIWKGGLQLKCFVIVSVTKYSCVFAAAFVKLTPEPTESAQQSFERIEHVIWALPVLTDVFMLLFTLRVTAMLFFFFGLTVYLCIILVINQHNAQNLVL